MLYAVGGGLSFRRTTGGDDLTNLVHDKTQYLLKLQNSRHLCSNVLLNFNLTHFEHQYTPTIAMSKVVSFRAIKEIY